MREERRKRGFFAFLAYLFQYRAIPPPPIPKLIESPLRASKHLAVSQDISGPPPPPPPYMRTQHICKTPEGRRGAEIYHTVYFSWALCLSFILSSTSRTGWRMSKLGWRTSFAGWRTSRMGWRTNMLEWRISRIG